MANLYIEAAAVVERLETLISNSLGLSPVQSRWKGSDQEPIQSNSTACPRHETGKKHNHQGWHQVYTEEHKAKWTVLFH